MSFAFLGKKKTPKSVDDEANWGEEDKKALEELKRALREYYNGENLSNRSRQLATLKMFGSWDDDDEGEDNEHFEDQDVKAWRQFCQDMSCFDDDQTRNRKDLYDKAEDEVASVMANPCSTAVWPVAIVQSSFQMNESVLVEDDDDVSTKSCLSPTRKRKKHNNRNKKTPHVDVVFVSQDCYRQAHGVEVMATPRDRVRDVYAGQGLAKF